jgi:hypothetical protein
MKEVQPGLLKQNVSPDIPSFCSQCGWPGTGKMPAGVGVIRQKGKTVPVGTLSYFRISTDLCSLCQEGIRGSKSAMVCQSARRIHGPNQSKKTVVGSWVNCSSSASLTCGWRIVISPMIPRDFPSLLRFCDGQSARSFHNRAPVTTAGGLPLLRVL